MQEVADMELLRQYAHRKSEEAFAVLVTRHVNVVYSAALRKTGNAHAAEEITQAVFIILAKKANRLRDGTILSGWLYQTARLTSASFLRTEIRRARREQEAYMQSLSNEPEAKVWPEIEPLLEDAMGRLVEKERNALALRFFEGKSFQEIGTAMGASENAAKKRVSHGLEKLRKFFTKRGVSSTTAIIAGAISANSVQAAPMALAKSVTAVAIAKGAAASGSTLTLIEGALKIMAWTKMKIAVVSSMAVLLAAGTTTIAVKEIEDHRTYPWQGRQGVINSSDLNQPPQVKIVPSRFHTAAGIYTGDKLLGKGVRAQTIVANAYGYMTPARVICSVELPTKLYDYIACLPGGESANEKALQAAVKSKFGVVGKTEVRDTDVWLLKAKLPNAAALKRHAGSDDGNGTWPTSNGFRFYNDSMGNVTATFEFEAKIPVLDETGLTNCFDFDLSCSQADLESRSLDNINEALGPLGLELVQTNMPVEMLVVEKSN
jgi:uncharacterized protein (TIGR03435 family)